MRITAPYYTNTPGDNREPYELSNGTVVRPHIMARSPRLIGVRGDEAVWSFGFAPGSEMALAFERESAEVNEPGQYGPLFVRATVKTGKVRETFRGALDMPASMRRVVDER